MPDPLRPVEHASASIEQRLDREHLLRGLAAPTPEAFASWVTEHARTELGVDVVLVGELRGGGVLRVLASFGEELPESELELRRTPLASTLGETREPGVGALDLWSDHVSVALRDERGRLVGVLAALSHEPLRGKRRARALLERFAPRLGHDLGLRRSLGMIGPGTCEDLSVLAGGVAHDVNNLLVGALGHTALLDRELPEDAALRVHVRAIEDASRRAADLARHLLACATGETSDRARVDASALVGETTELLQPSLPKRAVLRLALSEDLPPVEVEPTQIRRLVMNLVLNGAEALGDGHGVVSVRTALERVDRGRLSRALVGALAPEGAYVVVEVADTGPGMDQATLERAFEPFFTTKPTGQGLGLSAARAIVRDQRGVLEVDTAPGRGATFRVLLPPVRAEASADGDPDGDDGAEGWTGEGRVLVVDDEPSVRAAARSLLVSLGFDPVVARDGEEARERVQREDDLRAVLLDVSMPRFDAARFLEHANATRPSLPIVLMTGHSRREAARRCGVLRPHGFLDKPFGLDEVRRVLRAAVDPAR